MLEAHPAIVCAVIFFARLVDVSLGTVRTLLVMRGHKLVAAAIGFVEVLIWILAAGQVLQNLDAWYLALAYAGGFAAGNVCGVWLEQKLAIGHVLVRIVSEDPEVDLAAHLRVQGHHVIQLQAHKEERAPVDVLLVVEQRRRLSTLLGAVADADPGAGCTLSDLKLAAMPRRPGRRIQPVEAALRYKRK